MSFRREFSQEIRNLAARTAYARPHPRQRENGDEHRFRFCEKTAAIHAESHQKDKYWATYQSAYKKALKGKKSPKAADTVALKAVAALAAKDHDYRPLEIKHKAAYPVSFTKGLPHDPVTGLVGNPAHFQLFVRAIDSGDFRDFRDTPLGTAENCNGAYHLPMWRSKIAKENKVSVRAWESQSAGLSYDLQGPDAQAVVMPPAPVLGGAELTAEMGEVYVQALLRDVPFQHFTSGVTGLGDADAHAVTDEKGLAILCADNDAVKKIYGYTDALNDLEWFGDQTLEHETLSPEASTRRRGKLAPGSAFRGITRGDEIGPYLSQFLLVGDTGFANERAATDGVMNYGSIGISHKTRVATPGKNYLTTWNEWLDAQNAADLRGLETYEPKHLRRFIHTPRDLSTYVHFDALYEAYLNACISLLNAGMPFDPGIPFQEADNVDHQQGFAHFGGPHILSLVTEVATRALKAVRFQKYNVHRRCRPEVLAARIEKAELLEHIAPEFLDMKAALDGDGVSILDDIKALNLESNKKGKHVKKGTYLLPMAFAEGSPMHPAYGAGHATVAGACVTILKAFFDHAHPLSVVKVGAGQTLAGVVGDAAKITHVPGVCGKKSHALKPENFAYVSADDGKSLKIVPVIDGKGKLGKLTVEGELNKLASNIAIGRNWAGVHYFTDYYESILMGEEIAIAILEEQKLTFGENFSVTVPRFNGESYRI